MCTLANMIRRPVSGWGKQRVWNGRWRLRGDRRPATSDWANELREPRLTCTRHSLSRQRVQLPFAAAAPSHYPPPPFPAQQNRALWAGRLRSFWLRMTDQMLAVLSGRALTGSWSSCLRTRLSSERGTTCGQVAWGGWVGVARVGGAKARARSRQAVGRRGAPRAEPWGPARQSVRQAQQKLTLAAVVGGQEPAGVGEGQLSGRGTHTQILARDHAAARPACSGRPPSHTTHTTRHSIGHTTPPANAPHPPPPPRGHQTHTHTHAHRHTHTHTHTHTHLRRSTVESATKSSCRSS